MSVGFKQLLYQKQFVFKVYQYIWVSSSWDDPSSTKVCLQTTMNFTVALSPAFVIDGLWRLFFTHFIQC